MWTPTQLFYVCQVLQTPLASLFETRKDQQNKTKSHNKTQLLLDPFLLGSSSAWASSACWSELPWAHRELSMVATQPQLGERNVRMARAPWFCWKKTSTTTHSSIPLSSWGSSTFFCRLLFKECVHFLTKLLDDWKDLVPVPAPEVAPAGSILLSNHLI